MQRLVQCAVLGVVLSAGVMGVASCQRQSTQTAEGPVSPTDAEREAEIAAQQLAALGGPASAAQRALYEGDFQASGGLVALESGETGGEGAWELRLFDDYAQFSRPGLGEDGGIPGERDFRERGMRVVAGDVTITIMQQACTASGIELPYTAHVLFQGVAYQGCARRGVNEGDRPTWASVLPELMPAINVCLSRATSRPVRVTFAGEIGATETSVRLREANGLRHECISSEGSITVYEALSDLDRRVGEGDPEFQPGDAQPRAQNCRTSEQVIGRDGQPIGWLIRRSC